MPATITLDKSTKELLGVEKVHETFDGGQKYVFIATCKGVKHAIKMYKYGFGKREQRELEFYKNNTGLKGIPRIIEVITHKTETIVVEEYIKGDCLHDIVGLYKQDSKKISELICEIADIMEPIWKEKKTHRDLKPLNIIIQPSGLPVILDFGIFKDPEQTTMTDTGIQPHSWQFAAPEQHLGNKVHVSYRTDFFALGVIAYYLYYQKLPFGDKREDVLARMVAHDINYVTDSKCSLNPFFKATLEFDVSKRPRNVKLFKGVLS